MVFHINVVGSSVTPTSDLPIVPLDTIPKFARPSSCVPSSKLDSCSPRCPCGAINTLAFSHQAAASGFLVFYVLMARSTARAARDIARQIGICGRAFSQVLLPSLMVLIREIAGFRESAVDNAKWLRPGGCRWL